MPYDTCPDHATIAVPDDRHTSHGHPLVRALPSHRPPLAPWALLGLCALLQACGAITVRTDPALSTRKVPAAAASATPTATATPSVLAGATPPSATDNTLSAADGLKLARLLRDQGRYDGAAGVYARLEQRGALRPLEVLEYASVAAHVQTPQESLALFGRARRALGEAGAPTPAAAVTLSNGLGRARLALGQTDAALRDFDDVLAVAPDDITALNAKGVLLDARGEHDQARALLRRASELDPADFRVLNNLGLSYLASGDVAQAVQLLGQAEEAPWPTLKLNLAFAQTMQGREDDARRTLAGLMDAGQVQPALDDFARIRERLRGGAPVAQELLAAGRRLLPLRDKPGHG